MREHQRRARQIVEREIAQDVADLAGVDVALLKFRECSLLEMRAVRAGHRGIFDDGDRRLVFAQGQIGQRIRLHQVGGGHRFRQRIARERRQHRCAEHGGGERYGGGALTEFTSGDVQLMLRGLLARAEWELASSILQLWQWRAALPRSRKGSLSLDGRTQAGERLAQVLVLDRRQAGGDTGGDLRIRSDNGGPPCQGPEKAHFRLMAAPRRASAWRRSSSSIAGRLAAIRAATFGSSGGGNGGPPCQGPEKAHFRL